MSQTIFPTSVRILHWETNFANKLDKPEFLHVAKAPVARITESAIENQQFEIRTADGSHPPVRAMLDDICRVPLHNISDNLAMRSHGLTAFSLQQKLLREHPEFTPNTMMAVYFYKAVVG